MKKRWISPFHIPEAAMESRTLHSRGWQWVEHFILDAWWMLCFLLFSYMIYEHSLKNLQVEYNKLNNEYISLQQEKRAALKLQSNLLLQVNSQSDQDWIELTLMKGLGLVPEDQNKVFFSRE